MIRVKRRVFAFSPPFVRSFFDSAVGGGQTPPLKGGGLYTAPGGIMGVVVHGVGTEVVQGVVQIVQCQSTTAGG
jgi:hypothetical protein